MFRPKRIIQAYSINQTNSYFIVARLHHVNKSKIIHKLTGHDQSIIISPLRQNNGVFLNINTSYFV